MVDSLSVVPSQSDLMMENKQITEDSSDPDFSKSHPLEYEWTLWYDRRQDASKRLPGEKETYESNLRPIGTFSTVESFWQYYNHILKPSQLENNANYHLFKKGIKPMWEDETNKNGGKWVITIKGNTDLLDKIWDDVVLSMIGETLETGNNEICGAVASKRRTGDKIAVWNRSKDESISTALGLRLRKILNLDNRIPFEYIMHESSIKTGSSYSNPSRRHDMK